MIRWIPFRTFGVGLLLSLLSQCFLHQAYVPSSGRRGDRFAGSVPVRITNRPGVLPERFGDEQEASENDRIRIGRSYQTGHMGDYFRASSTFTVNPRANIRVEYTGEMIDYRDGANPFLLLFCLSGGVFPANGGSGGSGTFAVYDNERHTLLRTYKYEVTHNYLMGLLVPFVALAADPALSSVEGSSDTSTTVIERELFSRFEQDFRLDLEELTFRDRFFIGSARVLAVMPFEDAGGAPTAQLRRARELVETALLEQQAVLVDRATTDHILSEIAFAQSGLTESRRNQVGHLTEADVLVFGTLALENVGGERLLRLQIRAIEVETGQIVWKEEREVIGQDHARVLVRRAVGECVLSLRSRGLL